MSNIPGLQKLADNRDALLLAEVAAWLHDVGKCADEHIINQASDKPGNYSYHYKTAQSHRLPSGLPDISLLNETISVKVLIEQGMPRVINNASRPWILRVLGRCHAAGHVEKELADSENSTKQSKDDTRLSTAFGFESSAVKGLTAKLDALPFSLLQQRSKIVPKIQETFGCALGDTRRPVNEVTLADWSSAVAVLYKPALAGALLGVQPDPDALRWRLLRVNFDVLGLYAKALKIADLLAYQQTVEEACATIKQLVEEEYPLGNEIYRDTTGIYFIFPDLDLPADLAQEIRRRVEMIEPELAPRIDITLGDGATAQEQLKSILGKARTQAKQELEHPFDTRNLNPIWQQKWDEAQSKPGKWEVCPLCRLRPKRESDEVCGYCDGRRKSRLQTWLKTPAQTIWLGEIADHNDRVALLVGKFGLDGWLSGDLVQTMLVKAVENNSDGCVPKNPSPARLRRVWETCERFWTKTVEGESLPQKLATRVRKLIVPKTNNWQEGLYNGKVNGKPIDLFWQPEHNAFLTVSNLQAAGEIKYGDTITLKDPDHETDAGTFVVQKIEDISDAFAQYQPWLSLTASPDQFLVFLPAAAALDVARQIKSEYEKQFGKVRNRLPLALGVVYFERKMPLMAVMDAARHAARQMLKQPVVSEQWRVNSVDGNGQIKFENGITWHVPTTIGDGTTEDLWYPYWRVEGKPSDRTRWFVGPDGEHWVHVNDLKEGDIVHLTPSTFDFLWLDAAARRFEVGYDKKGRRPARPTRPYYLEDLDRLEEVWGAFSQLSRTQMKQTLQTIETARERWFGAGGLEESAKDKTFQQLVADTPANAGLMSLRAQRSNPQPNEEIASPTLRSGPAAAAPPGNDMQAGLITAAVRGELTDWAELHLEILKEKNEEGANA